MSRSARCPCSRRRRFRGIAVALLAVLPLAVAAAGQTLLPPDPSRTIGNLVPLDEFVDQDGHTFAALLPAAERARDPRPWILSPMYTRCPHTCSAVTTGLHRALQQSDLATAEYRIVSFSFDPQETDDGLRQFRARMHLPAEWLTLRATDRRALERTLASLDFRTITMAGGEFDHPNIVVVLAPDMRISSYLFGVNFTSADLARAVRRARDGISAADSWRPYLFVFALLGFLGSALLLVVLVSRRSSANRRVREAGAAVTNR